MSQKRNPRNRDAVITVSIKSDMPSVNEALSRLARELAIARQTGYRFIKIIHGYGSTGVGGEIRTAVQKRLIEMAGNAEIQAYVFGEDWSTSNDRTWPLLKANPELKNDKDLGKKNLGFTIVVL